MTYSFDIVRQTTASTIRTASGALLAGAVSFVPLASPANAQVGIKREPSGFNLFSVQQDIAVGRESALEIERQVRLVTSARTVNFLNTIAALLATNAPESYPIQVKAINSADVDLFVLPGGPVYVSRGLLSLTRSESEVAAVIAHAISHVVLRHGTIRASKAYLSRAGLSALGGLVGRGGEASRIVNTVGGLGLNASHLRFHQADEYEADALGAELLARSGYDPVAMSTVVATLRREKARGGAVERFYGQHPPVADRESRVRNLANVLARGRSEIVGGFSLMRWRGGTRSTSSSETSLKTSTGTVAIPAAPLTIDVPAPSPQFARFNSPHALVAIDYPENWEAHQTGSAMSFAPAGGVFEREDGAPNLLQGLIVNHYAPFENDVDRWNNSLTRHYAPFEDRSRPRGALEDATDDLIRQILSVNTWLTAPVRSARAELVDGVRGYSVRLTGRSPITGQTERVTVYTRVLLDDQIVYLACVAPGRGAGLVERACARMVQSMRINEAAANRQ